MPFLEAIFVCASSGNPMKRVAEIRAIAGQGLEGDRYALGTGYYSPRDTEDSADEMPDWSVARASSRPRDWGGCQLTLIEGEALDRMRDLHGAHVQEGEHRRNLVTRGLALRELAGHRLRIGEVLLEYERPRPPCGYVERITQKGMTKALGVGAGICVRVVTSGILREGAVIEVLPPGDGHVSRRLP